jgi:hydrogenase maturation protease
MTEDRRISGATTGPSARVAEAERSVALARTTLVVAYGNPLRQDDGVGWAVAAALSGRDDVEVRTVQQLLPEMAEALARAAFVVFVDARRGGEPGLVEQAAVTPAWTTWTGAHSLRPEELLGLCRRYYGRAPEAVLVSVAGERFGFGEELSPAVRAAIPRVVEDVLGLRGAVAMGRP